MKNYLHFQQPVFMIIAFIFRVFLACFVSIKTSLAAIEPERIICDVCVIGGGSGGFGRV